jgi:predicted  nucleic acid-binding Zn-ribbon protein
VIPTLAALIALQQIDSAVEAARRRLAELPTAEQDVDRRVAQAASGVDVVKASLAENQTSRRALEKDVAVVDTRLARFDDHKAAVKTNQEYTALLHEIATAKTEKEGIEDRILALMESADGLTHDLKAAEAAQAQTKREGDQAKAALSGERTSLQADVARLTAERPSKTAGVEPRAIATYDQLLKMRRGQAVAEMKDGHCTACHVRLRPNIEQQVRRNDSLVQCDSCQRLLYFVPTPGASAAAPPA